MDVIRQHREATKRRLLAQSRAPPEGDDEATGAGDSEAAKEWAQRE